MFHPLRRLKSLPLPRLWRRMVFSRQDLRKNWKRTSRHTRAGGRWFVLQRARGCGVYWWMDAAPTPAMPQTVSATMRMVLRGLLAALGAWAVEPRIALVLYRRISATMGQIERILVRFRAGRLWRVTTRVVAPGQPGSRKPVARLPRRFGWLVLAGGHQAACAGSQLQAVLNTQEMTELLACSVQARRILRPLCRALAVELPWVSGAAATDSCATPRRKRTPRAVAEPFLIPLPRGVLRAARRAGFGKGR